jgi:hypothetical protein
MKQATKGVPMMRSSGGIGLGGVIYLVVGAIIATQHHFFTHFNTIKLIVSAVLAIVLWPLILLGVDLHLR